MKIDVIRSVIWTAKSLTETVTKLAQLWPGQKIATIALLALLTIAGMLTTASGQTTFTPGQQTMSSILYGGDGDTGTQVLHNPQGVALDMAGDVFIADSDNDVVWEVSPSGNISIVAGTLGTACATVTSICGDGGPATSANLKLPSGVAVDRAGNLYIADYGDQRIREVYAPGGMTPPGSTAGYIVTVAGTGNECTTHTNTCGDGGSAAPGLNTGGMLAYPSGVAVDSNGNIYIADNANNRIRVVYVAGTIPNISSPTVGDIYTVAGNGTTCSPSTATCGDGSSAAYTGSAEMNAPFAVAVDGSGNIFIADRADNRIRVVYVAGTVPNISSPTAGYIYTVAGTGTQGYSGDAGLATSAELYYPYGIAVDSSDNIYIADTYNNRIRVVYASTNNPNLALSVAAAGYIYTVAGTATLKSLSTIFALSRMYYPAGARSKRSATIQAIQNIPVLRAHFSQPPSQWDPSL